MHKHLSPNHRKLLIWNQDGALTDAGPSEEPSQNRNRRGSGLVAVGDGVHLTQADR